MERTLILLKPDAVQRHLVGSLVERFERKGLKLVGLKLVQADQALAEKHYAVHAARPFFKSLLEFLTAGPTVALVLEGREAVVVARNLIGATDGAKASPGTIRGDLAVNIGRNVIHGSDAPETAEFEIGLWFQATELSSWTPADQVWRTES